MLVNNQYFIKNLTMNRRKAIGNILLITGGVTLTVSSYKGYQWFKKPDLNFIIKQKQLIEALAETIIPKTDTPGAKEAGVGEIIVILLRDCTSRPSQNKFTEGLKELINYCSTEYKKSYIDCTSEEQAIILRHFQEKGKPFKGIIGKVQNKFLGKSFYSTLAEYTTFGYCTSEIGAKQGLSYVLIPGRYNGCIPLEQNQRTWATK
jgi:hypothetical protein